MLSVTQIQDLAEENRLDITNVWETPTSTKGREVPSPKLVEIRLWFKKESPLTWATLMSNLTEVDVSVRGTRQMTGSGATDGTFYPCYAALLPEVNRRREAVGLEPLRN